MQDWELLLAYQAKNDESAFAELLHRHVNLVYSSALRQVTDPRLAEEIVQQVFFLLAKKAATLNRKVLLVGWLYRTTILVAGEVRRREQRRKTREMQAVQMQAQNQNTEPVWADLAPLLDQSMAQLGETDRLALMFRFFQQKSMHEVGLALGISEAAAKMRIARAIEKLRILLAQSGLKCSSAGLMALLAENTVQAAPVTLATGILTALASDTAVSTIPAATLFKMLWPMAKLKVALLVTVCLGAITCLVSNPHYYRAILTALGIFDNTTVARSKSTAIAARNPEAPDQMSQMSETAPAGPSLAELLRRLRTLLHQRPETNKYYLYGTYTKELDETIEQFGAQKSAALPVLQEALYHPDLDLRRRAFFAISRLIPTVPEAEPFLRRTLYVHQERVMSHDKMAYMAFDVLRHQNCFTVNDIPELAELIRKSLDLPELELSDVMATLIRQDRAATAPFIPILENLLDQSNDQVRFGGAYALAAAGAADHPKLLETITSSDPRALQAVRNLGESAKPLIPKLLDIARAAKDHVTKESVFSTLNFLDSELHQSVPEMDQVLHKAEQRQQWEWGNYTFDELVAGLKEPALLQDAVHYLGQMGPLAAEAVPTLLTMIEGQNNHQRNEILDTIHKIDPQVSIPCVDSASLFEGFEAAMQTVNVRSMEEVDMHRYMVLRAWQSQVRHMEWLTHTEFRNLVKELATLNPAAHHALVEKVIEKQPQLKDLLIPKPQP